MANYILIIFCISAGFIASKKGHLPPDAYKATNFFVVYFGIPALMLRYMPSVRWSSELLVVSLAPLVIWSGAWLFALAYSKIFKVDKATRAVLTVACGLENTMFFGYPLVTTFYGLNAVSTLMLFDLTNTMLFCILGIATVLKAASSEKVKLTNLAKRIFFFPGFTVCLLVLILSPFFDFSVLNPFLDLIVPAIAPLALFSIGLQFNFKDVGHTMGHLCAGLTYKLLLAPAIILLICWQLGVKESISGVNVLLAGTPSHILACLLAGQFNLNPRLCAMMVAFGIPMALISEPLWHLLTQYLLL
jgi:predicted permease